jgi:hypothetical protein
VSNETSNNQTNSTSTNTQTKSPNSTQDKQKNAEIASIFPGFLIPNTNDNANKKSLPYLKSIKINNEGILKVTFSEDLLIPGNITMIDEKVIKLEILPYVVSSIKDLNFTWKIEKFTNSFLDI